MAPFAKHREMGEFGHGSAVTYCVQIGDLDGGGALSIYHGTSMSSPNACGVAACVLSALEDRPNPAALRLARELVRRRAVRGPFAQGFGLVDAVGAVAYLEAHAGKPAQDVAFDVTVPSFGGGAASTCADAGQVASPAPSAASSWACRPSTRRTVRGPALHAARDGRRPHNGLEDDGRVDYAYAAVLDSGVPDRRFLRAPKNAEYAKLATGGATDSSLGVRIGAAAEFARLEVGAPSGRWRSTPRRAHTSALRPKSCKIAAGDALLDSLPPSDAVLADDPAAPATLVQDAVLAYAFDVRSANALDASSTLKVVPRAEALHAQLYDSPLDGAVWRLKDANGRVVDHGGLIHDQAPLLRARAPHPPPGPRRARTRQGFAAAPASGTPAALECPVLADRGPASVGGGTQMPAGFLRKDARRALYVRRPDKAAPSWVDPGDVMVGSINLDAGLLGGSRVKVPLAYEVPPKAKADGDDDDDDDDGDDLSDEEKDAKALLEALSGAPEGARRIEGRGPAVARGARGGDRRDHPGHLPLLRAVLDDAVKRAEDDGAAASKVVAAARRSSLPAAEAVSTYFGRDEPREGREAKKRGEDMDEKRKALRAALLAKALAAPEDETAVDDVKRWVPDDGALDGDGAKDDYALALARYESARGRPAAALALLRGRIEKADLGVRARRQEALELKIATLDARASPTGSRTREDLARRYPATSPPL
ncbi:tripeptidyl-peptidase [Aureococcus anophagefferens]|nr:tripeptidyl-peptidase [Aureococcus anophagefferens]